MPGVRNLTHDFCGDTIQPITHCVAVLSDGILVAATALFVGFYRQAADTGLWPVGAGQDKSGRGHTSESWHVTPRINSHLGKPLKGNP